MSSYRFPYEDDFNVEETNPYYDYDYDEQMDDYDRNLDQNNDYYKYEDGDYTDTRDNTSDCDL